MTEMRALAAELLRAHRADDRAAFVSAMNQAEGHVPSLLISLCVVANRAMDEVIGRQGATELVTRVAAELPPPPSRAALTLDAWRDAIALGEAAAREDLERAMSIMRHSPDTTLLFGMVMQLFAGLISFTPLEVLQAYFEEARDSEPPDVT